MSIKSLLYASLQTSEREEEEMISNTPTANKLLRPLRRSTRLNQAILLTVVGVDSYRGPYREQVTTLSISCHGCRYESHNDVLTNSPVHLELPPQKTDSPPVTARGIVRWIERSVDNHGPQQTAIELDDPGNIWGVDAPPSDWIEYCGPRAPAASTTKPKPSAAREPEAPAYSVAEGKKVSPSPSVSSRTQSFGRQMGDFQRQMEQTLLDAANMVVRERTTSALDEVRATMRDEANRLLAEAAANHAGTWMAEFVKQMKQASHDGVRALDTEWTKKISADLQAANEQMEESKRDLGQHIQRLCENAIERAERGLEISQEEAVKRIVGQLKEQVAAVLDDAKRAGADLNKNREALERTIDQSLDKCSVRIQETCTQFEKQFELIIQSRLDTAREELELARKK
jgi:hypothetical protein